ncbi:ParB-like nuclease family protein [Chelatococcus asaccharovorans]|uniref:ParB-like nuclease family protein n=2 Tax=Chelatococcus asaccharovorans TaxID=28210 RepID=A0A2V3UCH0_9HYPH|nr:ParB-like nuclease family protein [Chelatococcus asaccharovorans]
MDPGEFKRLVDNVSTDGALTSAVLACQNSDGSLEILSGHHRTEAAVAAGVEEIDVIVITTPLDEDRKAALQLSHNAITGKDNPSILQDMYRSLSLDAKMFSGLTDDILDGVDRIDLTALSSQNPTYEEIRLSFLPDDAQTLEANIDRLKAGAQKVRATHVARLADFDALFDAIVRVKVERGIVNSALAFLVMSELALERLDQLGEDALASHAEAGTAGISTPN